MSIPVISKFKKGFVGPGGVLDATNVEFVGTNIANVDTLTTAQLVSESLQGQIVAGRQAQEISRGSFQVFNDSFVISNTNAIINGGRVNIYGAKIDKEITVTLPTAAHLDTAGIGYPYGIEFVHSAGTGLQLDDNTLDILAGSSLAGDLIDIPSMSILGASNLQMLQGDIVLFVKEDAASNYVAHMGVFDPIAEITRQGVFAFKKGVVVTNIVDLSTELAGVIINQGDAILVTNGGTYFGQTIKAGSVIVAKTPSPSLLTTSTDWLVFQGASQSGNADQMAFFGNVARDKTRFDLSENVFVNPANVIEFHSAASGAPLQLFYFTSSGVNPSQGRTTTFQNQAVQFTSLKGGTLSLMISFAEQGFSGFLPELIDLQLDFDGIVFTFPLEGADVESGSMKVDITIPNADYSSILNTNCDITLDYNFRGVNFVGLFTIEALVNTLNGTLRASIGDLADSRVALSEARTDKKISALARDVDDEGSALQAIQTRISPYVSQNIATPDIHALFLDSTGSDDFPTDLSTFSQVSADNPRFTGGSSAMFVAVLGGFSYILKNITSGLPVALQDSEASVDLGESLTYNDNVYFVYRVSQLTSTHVYEIERINVVQVVAWANDIKNLQASLAKVNALLEHAVLNLPPALVDLLTNNVTVTEESNPTVRATAYNIALAAGNDPKVFYEPNPNVASSGIKNSEDIKELTGDQARRKLIYIPAVTFTNQAYVIGFDGSNGTDLISYSNGKFYAKVFVPGKSAGTSVETIYPAQAALTSGPNIWQTIPTVTIVNGVPEVVAESVSFTRDVPGADVAVNIAYRGHANGNIFGTGSITLPANQTSITFTLDVGAETISVTVARVDNQLRVRVTERVGTGLPVITDIEVILSYSETRVVPATASTVRDVEIEHEQDAGQVFAIKPSSTGTVVVVGTLVEVDTKYPYTTIFGATETGFLTVPEEGTTFLNYEDVEIIPSVVVDLENHFALPQFGLFDTLYTSASILNINAQLIVRDSSGNPVTVVE